MEVIYIFFWGNRNLCIIIKDSGSYGKNLHLCGYGDFGCEYSDS